MVYDVPSRVPTMVSPASAASGCRSFAIPKSSSLTTRLGAVLSPFDVAATMKMLLAFEIAVDDAARVRGLERRADRLQVLEHLGRRDSSLVVEHAAQVGPLEQLHHVERPPVGQLAELVDVDDVRVLDHVDRQRLAQEARDHLGRARQLTTQDLDRGATAEQTVLCLVDGAATARRQLSLEDVRAGERPRSQGVRIDRLRERARLIGT